MSNSAQRGRPPLSGPRTASGRRKLTDRGQAIWVRLKAEGRRFGLDPRLQSELSKLSWLDELSDTQVGAGFLVARVYSSFERHKRRRRQTASPSYNTSSFGDPDGQDPTDAIELQELEEKIEEARLRFNRLQEVFAPLPPLAKRTAIEVIETLCVDNQPIGSIHLPSVRAMLDRIAVEFKIAGSAKMARQATACTTSIAITAKRPPRRGVLQRQAIEHERQAYAVVARMGRTDLTDLQIDQMWAAKEQHRLALVDRARWRAEKLRRRAA